VSLASLKRKSLRVNLIWSGNVVAKNCGKPQVHAILRKFIREAVINFVMVERESW
jgi:hypothetical protein